MFIFNTKVAKPHQLMEENQYINIRYAFSKKVKSTHYTNITSWVKCRDFLNDAFFIQRSFEQYNTCFNGRIYGFAYKENLENTIDNISIISEDTNNLHAIDKGIITIINTLETSIYPLYKKTTSCIHNNDLTDLPVLVIEICPVWLTNTYTLSLFTLLLRLFTYPKRDINIWQNILTHPENTNDVYLVKTLRDKKVSINQLLLNLNDSKMPKAFDNENIQDILDDCYRMHERLGILSGVYDIRLRNYLNNKMKDIECPPDVRDVILF